MPMFRFLFLRTVGSSQMKQKAKRYTRRFAFSFSNNASLTCSFYPFCHLSSGRTNRSCAMKKHLQNRSCFVRIIPKENANFGLTLRKRLFCNAKPTLLPCKTAAFGMQNNRFCNALIASVLRKSFRLNKSLQFYEHVFV